jgi:endoglucanase Acf2
MFYRHTLTIIILFIGLLSFGVVKFYFVPKGDIFQNNQVLQDQTDLSAKILYEDINNLEHKTAFKEKVYTVDLGLPVPTNQWFSSVAFTQTSEPIFAYPLAVKMNNDGFGMSYPKVVSTPDTVFASYDPDLRVVFKENNLDTLIASHDDLSVGISQKNKDDVISEIRIAHGSPFVFVSISPKKSFQILSNDFVVLNKGDDFILFTVHGKFFAFFFSQGDVSVNIQDGERIDVAVFDKEAHFSIAVLPDQESIDIFKKYAFDPIIGTKVISAMDGKNVKSRFEITTKNSKETLLALLPKSVVDFDIESKNLQSFGKYQTLRGEQVLYQGKSFAFSRVIDSLPQQLSVSDLSATDKETLQGFVRDDTKNITITEEDTYFLGKKLFALANILDIAEQLGMDNESTILKTMLRNELELWRDNTLSHGSQKKYFYYDSAVKGIVGETASFGSELFNDHNFHYGYFIYAASILSRYDKDYLDRNENFINLLVKDIANIDRNDNAFPYLRGFDAYEGHSWASGRELFADGNNQESSSEAVNAWYALYLWSGIIDNKKLQETALYLYSEESSSALEYWLNINRKDDRFVNFKHSFISLLWSGKIDAGTWFSARPEAKLGIQVIPVSPGSLYLGRDIKRVQENMLSEKELQKPTMFKDYLAMYSALYDAESAQQKIQSLKPEDIDSANSRSFMEAWLMTLDARAN